MISGGRCSRQRYFAILILSVRLRLVLVFPSWFWRELWTGDTGSDVAVVALKLGSTTRAMDDELLARVRGFQRAQHLPVTGIVDLATARALGESATYGLTPQWFGPPIDYEGLRRALRCSPWDDLDSAIRRFQSAHRHEPDGVVTELLATEIGD